MCAADARPDDREVKQSTMSKPRATMRSGFLTHTVEARNKGYAQEAQAAFDAALLCRRRHEFLIRKDARVQDSGRDDETRFAPRCLLDLRVLDADRCLDAPLHRGSRFCAGTPFAGLVRRTDELALHLQPDRQSFQCALERCFCIGLTGKMPVGEVPQLLLPPVLSFLAPFV
jgi:hypothetical protein